MRCIVSIDMFYRNSTFVLLCLLTYSAMAVGAEGEKDLGRQTYERACASCHKGGFGGFFTGAPKTGKRSAWKPLLEKGIDELVASTLEGIGKMKPRGECEDCSDLEIVEAVKYMVRQVD